MNHHSKENPPFPLDQEVVAGTTTVTGNDDVVMVIHPQRLQPNEQFRDEKAVVSNAIQMLHSAIDRVINEEIMQPMIEQQQQHRAMMEEFHSTPIPSADENQTNAFLNLQQAVQESQTQLQDITQSIRNEARLRAELSDMTAQRNDAMGQMEEQKHKVSLLQEQMTDLKIKLSRYQQEKMQSERQLQHLIMMSKHQKHGGSVGFGDGGTFATPSNHTSTSTLDAEYYQRKYNESNQKVQSFQAMMIEKNRQIDDLRYQVERHMNQQQYANLQHHAGPKKPPPPQKQQERHVTMSSSSSQYTFGSGAW